MFSRFNFGLLAIGIAISWPCSVQRLQAQDRVDDQDAAELSKLRIWKDASGRASKYSMRLVELSSGHAVMRTKNGKLLTVSLSRLSRVDHEFIAEHIKATLDSSKGQAIRAIERVGGRVWLDFQVPGMPTTRHGRAPANALHSLAR